MHHREGYNWKPECHRKLASFPGHSHLQYLIACSMRIWRGKAWNIWPRAMMSGRQRIDTQGVVPNIISCWTVCGAVYVNDEWYWCCLSNAMASSPWTDNTRKGFEILHQVLPPVCLPDVTAHNQISQAFPLHICILQVIKYWRWEQPGNEANRMPGNSLCVAATADSCVQTVRTMLTV